jgi:hypothetical protein
MRDTANGGDKHDGLGVTAGGVRRTLLASTAPSSKPEWRAASRSAARSVASAVKANWRPNCAASWRVRSEPARASSCRRRSATRCCLCSCAPHALQCLPRQRLRKSRRARQPAPSHQHTSCCVVLKPLKHPHPPPKPPAGCGVHSPSVVPHPCVSVPQLCTPSQRSSRGT